MNYTKHFDLHVTIEKTISGSHLLARCVLGNNGVMFTKVGKDSDTALIHLMDEMEVNGILLLLPSNPSMSLWPLPTTAGNHTHSHTSTSTAHLFDLHIECGKRTVKSIGDDIYAFTQFDYAGSLHSFINNSRSQSYYAAIIDLIMVLKSQMVFTSVMGNPNMSQFPFKGSISGASASGSGKSTRPPKAVLVEEAIKEKDIVRKLPNEITDIPHPKCKDVCTSIYHFGKSKCASMCEWRPEV